MPIAVSLSRALPTQTVDVAIPDGADARSLVVCIHGGWWHQGHRHDLRGLMLSLAEHGWPAATVGGRLLAPPGANPGPEHARGGSDLLADLIAALPGVAEEAALNGWNGRSIVLLGSGSGSLLALLAASRLTLDRHPGIRVRAAVACGVTPGLDHNDGWALGLAPVIDRFAGRDRHALSPLHVTPHGFPPLLLLHGDKDVDVPAVIAQRLHQRVAGAEEVSEFHLLAGLGHHFVEHPASHGGRLALERLLPFLDHYAREPADG